MADERKSSRIATAGALLAAATCALAILSFATSADALFPVVFVMWVLAIVLCVLGFVIALMTGRRGVGRATAGGTVMVLPLLLVSMG